jgi:ribosome-associated protein
MSIEFPPSLILSVSTLQERLAEDLQVLCVRDVSTVTDYFVLATGTSTPHLNALTEEVDIARKNARLKMKRKGGRSVSGWEVLDFGDVVVHVMTPELREFYALEQLWSDAKKIDPDEIVPASAAPAE